MGTYDDDCIRSHFLDTIRRCQNECSVNKHPSASMLAKPPTDAHNLGEASPPQREPAILQATTDLLNSHVIYMPWITC